MAILTISGRPGAGKSSIEKILLREYHFNCLPSYTTRKQKPSDFPNEYVYISEEEFERRRIAGEFLKAFYVHGSWRGTRKLDIWHAIEPFSSVWIAVITLEAVAAFRDLVKKQRADQDIFSLYITTPESDSILIERMRARGDSHETAIARVAETYTWDDEAASIPYMHIVQNSTNLSGDVRPVVNQIIASIRNHDTTFFQNMLAEERKRV